MHPKLRTQFGPLSGVKTNGHPRVEIDVSFESRFVDPISEGFDLVLRISEPDEETVLVDHRILDLAYVVCAAPDYLDRRGTPTEVQDLASHAILHLRQAARTPAWSFSGPQGPVTKALRPVLTANSLDMLLAASRAGLGISIMPEYAVRSDLASGRLVPVLCDYKPLGRTLQVIYPPARHLSAKVRLFVEFVQEWCGVT